MSEDAAVFARRNELDDPFPIVADEAAVPDTRASQRSEAEAAAPVRDEPLSTTGAVPGDDLGNADDRIADPAIAAILADDSQSFLQALIGVVAGEARSGRDAAGLGLVLACLGQAMSEGLDEEQSFQELVEAMERRRLGETALQSTAPLMSIFVARLVGATRRGDTAPERADAGNLLGAAAEVVDAALRAGGARAWRRLPDIAVTIAERAMQRGLSIAELTDALPRLAARFGLGSRGPAMRVVANPDQPRSDFPRGEAAERPRRMLISGPVEIVILDR